MRSRVTDSAKSDRDRGADPEAQTHAGPFCALTQFQMLTTKLWMTLAPTTNL